MGQRKKTLILGLGVSGRSAAALLLKAGIKVIGIDSSLQKLKTQGMLNSLQDEGLELVLEDQLCLDEIEECILSPGASLNQPVVQALQKKNIPLVGEVQVAFRFLKPKIAVGITGTNGKTTTTHLLAHVLNQSQKPALAVGNVGVPLTSLTDTESIWVVELSSFQLETLNSQELKGAVLLNITPDHLDRYESMQEYAKAKIKIGSCLQTNAPFYIFEQVVRDWNFLLNDINFKQYGFENNCALFCDQTHIIIDEKIEYILPSGYRGKKSHDLENILAAYGLCKELGVTADEFDKGLQSFVKPSHRVQYVATIEGVTFIDDSKGTNLDAVAKALQAIETEVILIAGGVHKGAPYKAWGQQFKGKVKAIFAIGQAKALIKEDLHKLIDVHLCSAMEDAVQGAYKMAIEGDTILLSPGCASYDMYTDYAHRGREFQSVVKALVGKGEQVL